MQLIIALDDPNNEIEVIEEDLGKEEYGIGLGRFTDFVRVLAGKSKWYPVAHSS